MRYYVLSMIGLLVLVTLSLSTYIFLGIWRVREDTILRILISLFYLMVLTNLTLFVWHIVNVLASR